MITQNQIEHILHPQHVKESIYRSIQSDLYPQIRVGIDILQEWLKTPSWESVELKKDIIRQYDLEDIVLKIVTTIAMRSGNYLSLVAVAGMIHITDELLTLQHTSLVCDLIALLEPTGLYELDQTVGGTYVVKTLIQLDEKDVRGLRLGCYLPPMLVKPMRLDSNTDSGYLTINRDSLILGDRANDHTGNISLDVLNTLNSNEYELDTHIINMIKPNPITILTPVQIAELTTEDRDNYNNGLITYERYLEQFQYLKTHLEGRTIHFTHKVDKRGRIYSQGYHFSPQGSDYEKACINLNHKELITGEL